MATDHRTDNAADEPLDPNAERVRRRLVRFAAINIGILFVAVMLVLGAIVYKTFREEPAPAAGPDEAPAPPTSETVEGRIVLPQGARIVSQSLSGTRLSLQLALSDGSTQFIIYDTRTGRAVGRFAVAGEAR